MQDTGHPAFDHYGNMILQYEPDYQHCQDAIWRWLHERRDNVITINEGGSDVSRY